MAKERYDTKLVFISFLGMRKTQRRSGCFQGHCMGAAALQRTDDCGRSSHSARPSQRAGITLTWMEGTMGVLLCSCCNMDSTLDVQLCSYRKMDSTVDALVCLYRYADTFTHPSLKSAREDASSLFCWPCCREQAGIEDSRTCTGQQLRTTGAGKPAPETRRRKPGPER